MILCNQEIQAALDAGMLIIEPQPTPRQANPGQYCPFDTHSVDLTLAPEISIPQKGPYSYDLVANGLAQFIGRNSQKVILETNQPFALGPSQFVLAMTREVIGLPILAGRDICLSSSAASCGIGSSSPTMGSDGNAAAMATVNRFMTWLARPPSRTRRMTRAQSRVAPGP
jgi:deoxycytidine triphosphate deaminase